MVGQLRGGGGWGSRFLWDECVGRGSGIRHLVVDFLGICSLEQIGFGRLEVLDDVGGHHPVFYACSAHSI